MGSRITQLANFTHQYHLSLHGLLGHRLLNSQPRVLITSSNDEREPRIGAEERSPNRCKSSHEVKGGPVSTRNLQGHGGSFATCAQGSSVGMACSCVLAVPAALLTVRTQCNSVSLRKGFSRRCKQQHEADRVAVVLQLQHCLQPRASVCARGTGRSVLLCDRLLLQTVSGCLGCNGIAADPDRGHAGPT